MEILHIKPVQTINNIKLGSNSNRNRCSSKACSSWELTHRMSWLIRLTLNKTWRELILLCQHSLLSLKGTSPCNNSNGMNSKYQIMESFSNNSSSINHIWLACILNNLLVLLNKNKIDRDLKCNNSLHNSSSNSSLLITPTRVKHRILNLLGLNPYQICW